MKAHVLGFRWELLEESADALSLADLFNHMAGLRNVEREFNSFPRLIYVGETERYHTGLLLTAKTHRRFCELHRGDEALKINVREAEEGVDEDGLEKTVALTSNPDSFGHYEFDELAADMEFEPEKFQESKFMQTLLALADDNAAVLEVRAV